MKIISVPLTTAAMDRLNVDSTYPGDLLEIELSENEFNDLFKSGLIKELNMKLGLMIDDYEDENIPIELIPESLKIISQFNEDGLLQHIDILKIKRLFTTALDKKTGVFFFF